MNHRKIMARLNGALQRIDASYAGIGKRFGLTLNGLMLACLLEKETEQREEAGGHGA